MTLPICLGAPAAEPLPNLAGQLARSLPPSQKGKEQTCRHPAPVQSSGCKFALTHVPLGSSQADLRAGRLKHSQVSWPVTGETSGHPCSSDQVLGCPFCCFPARLGVHMSPWKHKTALMKANIVDFKQQQQNTRKGVSITALPCVFGSLGSSPVPSSWSWEVTFLP